MKPETSLLVQGKYLLERPIAQGGMGQVWVAQHVELDVPVAVKFLDPSLADDDEFVRRFQREARAAAKLHSAHVARIFDYGVEQGSPFIVMELLTGENLAEHLARVGRMTLLRIAEIVVQLGKGLAEAHAQGIVHRDLKPSNIFLASVAGEEVVKVIDFGIAKEIDRPDDGTTTASDVLMGSPRYISPEQARGSDIDHRTDVWSLGVVIFEAVLGRPVFESEHHGDLIAAITGDPLPVPSEIDPEVLPGFDDFIEQALARQPRFRFQTVHELSDALCALAGFSPAAGPRTRRIPPRRGPGRNTPTVPLGRRMVSEPVDIGVATTIPRHRRRNRLAWLLAGVGVAFAAALTIALNVGDDDLPAGAASAMVPTADTTALPSATHADPSAQIEPIVSAEPSAREVPAALPKPAVRPKPKTLPPPPPPPPPKGEAIDPQFGVPVTK